MANAIEAGKAFVRFILDDKGLETKLGSIAGKFRKFGSIGLAATTPILTGFAAAAGVFASVGDELNKLSDRTGVSVSHLSELKHAAEQSDVSMEDLEMSFRNMQKKGIDPARFDELAAQIAAIEDPTARAQAAMEVFGRRSGTAILPMLKDLPALRQEARNLGLTLNDETADAATNLGDQFANVKAQLTALAVQVGAAIAGPLTDFFVWAQGVLAWVIGFVHENPKLVAAIAAVTAGIAAASSAAVTFGIILAVISAHPIIAALTAISALVIGLTTYFAMASDEVGVFAKSLDGLLHALALPLGLLKDLVEKLTGITGLIGKHGDLVGLDFEANIASPIQAPAIEGARVQSQLSAAVSTPTVVPSPTVPIVHDDSPEMVRWTRETAEGVKALVNLVKASPARTGIAFLP